MGIFIWTSGRGEHLSDPTEFLHAVQQLADTYSVLNKQPVAKAVKVLAMVAQDETNPLSSVAVVALDIMAQAYDGGSRL